MPNTDSDAALRAIINLARVLIEAAALDFRDVATAADRVEREGERLPEKERERFEWAAHWLRCAALPVTEGCKPALGVIDGGKD